MVAGVAILLMGLHFLGILRFSWLTRTKRVHDVLVGRVEAVTLGPDKAKLAYLGRGFLSV